MSKSLTCDQCGTTVDNENVQVLQYWLHLVVVFGHFDLCSIECARNWLNIVGDDFEQMREAIELEDSGDPGMN